MCHILFKNSSCWWKFELFHPFSYCVQCCLSVFINICLHLYSVEYAQKVELLGVWQFYVDISYSGYIILYSQTQCTRDCKYSPYLSTLAVVHCPLAKPLIVVLVFMCLFVQLCIFSEQTSVQTIWLLFVRNNLAMQLSLTLNSFGSPDWPGTCDSPPGSPSQVLVIFNWAILGCTFYY